LGRRATSNTDNAEACPLTPQRFLSLECLRRSTQHYDTVGESPCTKSAMADLANRMIATKNTSFAAATAAVAIPPNPNMAAINATMSNVTAHPNVAADPNMAVPPLINGGVNSGAKKTQSAQNGSLSNATVAEPALSRRSSAGTMVQKGNRKRRLSHIGSKSSPAVVAISGVALSHPDRIYWDDSKITKRDLAEFYSHVWKWMRPHVVDRPISLLRCPTGAAGPCFFQKHAAAGIATENLYLVAEKGDKVISIDDLAGLISLVQAGVLEIHTRGATVDDRERADRLVFDLDPGPGTRWRDVVAAAIEVRERLARLKLESFVKTSGGKGLHVVLPVRPVPWNQAKNFCHAVAAAMAADDPNRYVATATKSRRNNRIFLDYLRNSREATAVAPYSTRARPGAPVSTPLGWSELGAIKSADQYTVSNLAQRLARLRNDPWASIGRLRQELPKLKS